MIDRDVKDHIIQQAKLEYNSLKTAFIEGWLMCKENMTDVHVLGEDARKTPEEMFEQSFSKIITKG